MEIKSLFELHNAIKVLRPGASYSIWDTNDLKEYQGDNEPILMFDRLINWSPLNPFSCPNEEEIKGVKREEIDAFLLAKENMNMAQDYKNDPLYKKAFKEHKSTNPDATFEDFIIFINR